MKRIKEVIQLCLEEEGEESVPSEFIGIHKQDAG
jgi:predicted RNase H-like HicB family nuclease